jgi:hypothetical protein
LVPFQVHQLISNSSEFYEYGNGNIMTFSFYVRLHLPQINLALSFDFLGDLTALL